MKNFSDKLDDVKLQAMFEKYGPIISCVVMKDGEGKSRGFGFVSFEKPEDAEKAVTELNGCEVPDTEFKLTVCRAQKKAEREAELSRLYEQLKAERLQRVSYLFVPWHHCFFIFSMLESICIARTSMTPLTATNCVATLSLMETSQA